MGGNVTILPGGGFHGHFTGGVMDDGDGSLDGVGSERRRERDGRLEGVRAGETDTWRVSADSLLVTAVSGLPDRLR